MNSNWNLYLYLNREQAAMVLFQQVWSWIHHPPVGWYQCHCLQVLDMLLFLPEAVMRYDQIKFVTCFDIHLSLVGWNCYFVQGEAWYIRLPRELLPCDGCEGIIFHHYFFKMWNFNFLALQVSRDWLWISWWSPRDQDSCEELPKRIKDAIQNYWYVGQCKITIYRIVTSFIILKL